jgi:septation ring formation regulator EzrA
MKSNVAPYLMVIGIVILLVVFKRYHYLHRKKEQAQASTLED